MTVSPARRIAAEPLRILVVDDESMHARLLKANLERPGRVAVDVAASGEEALALLSGRGVDAVLSDVMMPGIDGIELVRRIRESDPTLPVILMTAHGTIERAVEGIRAGATEFVSKPINVTAVVALVERAVAERPLREEITARREREKAPVPDRLLTGSHPRLDRVRIFARQVAAMPESRVLITGESGTGKSLLARMIHELSGVPGRFVEVNCGALPAHLVESELFGHEKGAFTDAKGLKRGLVETADRGTLFLDEIGTLPLELQTRLLQFLETREIRRVGGTQAIPVRTRVVAATNEDLRRRAQERTFRQDLLYRLDVAAIEMPALREMPSVIPALAESFTRSLCVALGRPLPELSARSFARLADYAWPGNARELKNAVERTLIFHAGGPFEVTVPAVSGAAPVSGEGVFLEMGLTLEEVERRYLGATLETSGGELDEIAQQLGISRKTLWEKRRRYGLSR